MNFSALMSVYAGSDPDELIRCFKSVIGDAPGPDEIVLVVDGPIGEGLEQAVNEIALYSSVKTVRLAENAGLSEALNSGLEYCSNELVARMDTDDVVEPGRFAAQLKAFEDKPSLSVCGGQIAEFSAMPEKIVSYRRVPLSHEEIAEFMKSRCPFNHMSVMYRKSEVLRAGGYRHLLYLEDYYLWVRMFINGCEFQNLDKVLVRAKVDIDTIGRRGGTAHYKSEKTLFKFMRENKLISSGEYLKNKFKRFVGGVLLPRRVRAWAFKRFLRNPAEDENK